MKANDRQAKRNLSAAELAAELRQAEEKRFRLTFKHRVTPLTSPLELRELRRHVARLKTWLREKQAQQPVQGAKR